MKRFATLFHAIDASTSNLAKQAALQAYLQAAPAEDAAWAVYFLAGGKPRQLVPTRLLRELAREAAGLPEWLFDESYEAVGDLAETISLLLPAPAEQDERGLAEWMAADLLPLRGLAPEALRERLLGQWRRLAPEERLPYFKLITGAFRVGVSRLQVTQALAAVGGLDAKLVAQRLMGYTHIGARPGAADYAALIAPPGADAGLLPERSGQPYPFFLAHPFNEPLARFDELLGPPADWLIEWKWDGIRAQLVWRGGQAWLWSRGEELITERFPELAEAARALPEGTVIDGEIVVFRAPDSIAADAGGAPAAAAAGLEGGNVAVAALPAAAAAAAGGFDPQAVPQPVGAEAEADGAAVGTGDESASAFPPAPETIAAAAGGARAAAVLGARNAAPAGLAADVSESAQRKGAVPAARTPDSIAESLDVAPAAAVLDDRSASAARLVAGVAAYEAVPGADLGAITPDSIAAPAGGAGAAVVLEAQDSPLPAPPLTVLGGGVRAFAELQKRIGRKTLGPKILREQPVALLAYDLLEVEGRDLRGEPQHARRARLEALLTAHPHPALHLSPQLQGDTWAELARQREAARALGTEGFMLKRRDAVYGIGRTKVALAGEGGGAIETIAADAGAARAAARLGGWWKWKIDPMSVDAVLIYAQRGHGRRASLYTDYTFAVWSGPPEDPDRTLVPFAKAYSGLTDAEIAKVDAIIRKTTRESFGPVRSVEATQVFELGFEGIARSPRHKSGIAVRFPRMLRWRQDKPVAEADTLQTLAALLPG